MECETDRLRPMLLWRLVSGPYTVPMKVTPRGLMVMILAGRASPQLIEKMMAVVTTAQIINRMMGYPDNEGV